MLSSDHRSTVNPGISTHKAREPERGDRSIPQKSLVTARHLQPPRGRPLAAFCTITNPERQLYCPQVTDGQNEAQQVPKTQPDRTVCCAQSPVSRKGLSLRRSLLLPHTHPLLFLRALSVTEVGFIQQGRQRLSRVGGLQATSVPPSESPYSLASAAVWLSVDP